MSPKSKADGGAASTVSAAQSRKSNAPSAAAKSAAPTTTTVLNARVDGLRRQLEEEKAARLIAEADLAETNRQLAALESVLGLSAPGNLPSNKVSR